MRFCTTLIVALTACLQVAPVLNAQEAKPTKDPVTFKFGDTEYLHRYSDGDLHEFTPKDQEDLMKWSDMVTVNFYPMIEDGEGLAEIANAVLANYKANGAKVIRTNSVPKTKDKPAEHLIVVLFAREEFMEVAFARIVLQDYMGSSVVYSHRAYGAKSGDEIGAWLKANGLAIEKNLMKWDAIPSRKTLNPPAEKTPPKK